MKKTEPLISFVLIAYNQEKFIKDAVIGAFSQVYGNLEIVLSDDSSSDNTYKIIEALVKNYQGNHKIILNKNSKNLGIGAHFQKAVSISSDKWIIAAGGDDISYPERTSVYVNLIREFGEVACISARFDNSYNAAIEEALVSKKSDKVKFISGKKLDWLKLTRRGKLPGIPGCSVMWNRKLFEIFPPIPQGVMAEDVILKCRAFISGLGIIFTSSKVVYYRSHDNNQSSGLKSYIHEKNVFYAKATAYKELIQFSKDNPNIYSKNQWNKVFCFFEEYLYRAVVLRRSKTLGRFLTSILLFLGLSNFKKIK